MQFHLINQSEPTLPSRNLHRIPLRLRQLYPHSFNVDSNRWQTPIEPQPLGSQTAPINNSNHKENPNVTSSKQDPFTFAQAFHDRLFPQPPAFVERRRPNPNAHSPTAATARLQNFSPEKHRIFLLGGWLIALFTIAINLGGAHGGRVNASAMDQSRCQKIVQSNAVISRAQLAQVLTVPERSPQSDIRAQLPQPYCQLQDIEMRAGVTAQREAYPLAFDPQTWLVLLFEEDEYAGYAFQF